jgi:hypothetical protein
MMEEEVHVTRTRVVQGGSLSTIETQYLLPLPGPNLTLLAKSLHPKLFTPHSRLGQREIMEIMQRIIKV